MNGFGAPGRRRAPARQNPVTYPFKSFDGSVTLDKPKSGERVWDINMDGVAHYGLYPDWVEDLRMPAGDEIVNDMARGAEAYLQMWERAEGVPAPTERSPRAAMTARGIGTVRLGDSYVEALQRAGQPPTAAAACGPGRSQGRAQWSRSSHGRARWASSPSQAARSRRAARVTSSAERASPRWQPEALKPAAYLKLASLR